MGWTRASWLFTPLLGDVATRWLASVLLVLVTIAFGVGTVGLLAQQAWWPPLVVASAACSTVAILLLWNGSMQMVVQKGLVGPKINMAILVALLVFRWPQVAR
jgi:hypothetical protein